MVISMTKRAYVRAYCFAPLAMRLVFSCTGNNYISLPAAQPAPTNIASCSANCTGDVEYSVFLMFYEVQNMYLNVFIQKSIQQHYCVRGPWTSRPIVWGTLSDVNGRHQFQLPFHVVLLSGPLSSPRDAMLARYMPQSCVGPSVR